MRTLILLSTLVVFIICTVRGLAGQEAAEITLTPSRLFTAEPFSRVRGVEELPDGRVLLVDQREEALYRIDFEAGTREMLGHRGRGPGEYKNPTGLHPFRGDSALMVDIVNGRFVVVSPEGELARTEPLFGPGVSLPEGADRYGNRYWDRVTGVRLAKREDPSADQAPIVRYEYASGQIDTLAFLTIPGPPNPNAFPAWDDWAVGPDGRVAIVRNQDEYRLDWVERDGTVRRGPPVEDFRPLRVSDDDERALRESRGGGYGGVARQGDEPVRRPPPIDVPDHFPPGKLRRLWVTYDRLAIVERHQHLSEERPLFDVFDADGSRTGSFRLPAGRELVGTGPSGLYAVREDELGFLWLELYEFP
ncbi:MAG: hypothetical protein GWN99_16035 [Gemmatimonadetes bacterium]|uniref:6-bladed beta-propeller n=1 Tax=Candidatus Kutchimonas denitrificans TaxID=3056748 RepID=A0AAE5CCK3_9BACT|nr:hypothetical protein [Gemmatimonadota bacterium]NIR74294.1 hypothetical protein [Candidatus Kutchimonas denitrificans]NIS02549.1 hypothetical protein [Gemmatimonadota bacterium]NIT68425.1 hypothetical protein [Gemmatimonadota bacterium]NIU51877.1 hypothetical protein [Gemmatimonadota bacterium]